MTSWTLEKAKNQFSEVVRRALAHEPQMVTRGRHDAVVVIARDDYERLIAPGDVVEFLRSSPVAEAIAGGDLPEDAFERQKDLPRRLDF
jgi:prevent-host-death family protein